MGTGGLLIVYGKTITNSGRFISTGSNGYSNSGYIPGAGGSGGGSINIFYQDSYTSGTLDASGGAPSNGQSVGNGNCYGGAGGNGSISSGCIATGTYVAD